MCFIREGHGNVFPMAFVKLNAMVDCKYMSSRFEECWLKIFISEINNIVPPEKIINPNISANLLIAKFITKLAVFLIFI